MLMLDLWPQAETPGVAHFGAYHRPPDGHFLNVAGLDVSYLNVASINVSFLNVASLNVSYLNVASLNAF